MRRPTLHGNEFVSAERILQAALEDGPIGFMLLEEPPSSLPAFGFVPTGADKGVEMEVEMDKVVTAADIPKPYHHLRDVFDEVEADKLPHHTECHGPECSGSRRAPVESMAVVQSPWRPWTPTDSHAKEERAHM
ncbi:uncharacterized protein UDID_17931 [Ustilago sp. UG-2017a]|nr:uncharacterized protein UDID_17931 [Ustilago sp. UG-2017a]